MEWKQRDARDSSYREAVIIKWINQMLNMGGHADHLVTDLASDMADGITLLKLVQVLANEALPKHSPAPIMRAKKLENLQVCLSFLQQQHVPVDGVQAEALLAGDIDSVLTVCNSLKKHFVKDHSSQTTHNTSSQGSYMDTEDISILAWVGWLVHRDITTYSALHDGNILCELVNILHKEAIDEKSQETDSIAKLKMVVSAAKKYLVITSSFDPQEVSGGGQDERLRSFLEQCKEFHQQQIHQHKTQPQVEQARKSLSGCVPIGGEKEGREAAHINARPYGAIQKKKTEGKEYLSQDQPKAQKRLSDLYVQGASSFTDLSTRRSEHQHMIRGAVRTGNTKGITKYSSSDNLDLKRLPSPLGNVLDRVQSMDSGIAQQQNRYFNVKGTDICSASQDTLPPPQLFTKSIARRTESFHTQTFGPSSTQRTPSYVHFDSGSSEDLSHQLNSLEERVGVLATQFLYERQDMFKQILRALIKERKKRQFAERRIEAMERASKQLVQHYDSRLIDLAKEVSTLRTEVATRTGGGGGVLSNIIVMEIEQIKEQLTKLTRICPPSQDFLGPLLQTSMTSNKSLFMRKRTTPELPTRRADGAIQTGMFSSYSKGSVASFKKLSHFFGEDPPRLENLESLLDYLGYIHLLPKLRSHNISIAELRLLSEDHLEAIGIPLGERVRLLEEVRKLEQIDDTQCIH